ncbi:MAG: hypothetical protein ACPGEC_00110 [Flavobacteriales bacterium]
MYLKHYLISAIIFLSFFSCDNQQTNPDFPQVNVNLSIYPGTGTFYDLGAVGGWMYLGGGVNGLLVYRATQNGFMVYDRACPYDPTNPCEQIEVQNGGGFILEDQCCGSTYFISSGEVNSGPSTYNLKQYYSYYNGSELQIGN